MLLDPRATFPAVVDGQLEYATTINGEPVRIPGRDVFHVKALSHDGLVGHSVLDVMADSLGLGLGARIHVLALRG